MFSNPGITSGISDSKVFSNPGQSSGISISRESSNPGIASGISSLKNKKKNRNKDKVASPSPIKGTVRAVGLKEGEFYLIINI